MQKIQRTLAMLVTLALLASCGAERVLVRVPRIPGFNTAEDQRKSAEALRNMGVTRLDLFDYVVRAE